MLTQFKGYNGFAATFDDAIWFHVDPNTRRKTRYLAGRHNLKGRGSRGTLAKDLLPYPYSYLIKVWIIETASTSLSSSEKRARITASRKLLSLMNGPLYAQSEESVIQLGLSARTIHRLAPFLAFCSEKGLIKKIYLRQTDSRDRTGHASLDHELTKIPSVECILALGAMFSEIFEGVSDEGICQPDHRIDLLDALVVTFSLLSLASPNRMIAELPLLRKQRLQSRSEAGGDAVYFLDWVGSKGFGHYRNHLLAALADPIKKAVNFFNVVCEPARALCRYYENPNQRLSLILGDFVVPKYRASKISMGSRPNIFILGYALGFYGDDDQVPVLKGGVNPAAIRPHQSMVNYEMRPIYELRNQDVLSAARSGKNAISSLPHLFGYSVMPSTSPSGSAISVEDLERWWISYFRDLLLPEFPLSFSTGECSIRIKDALFCLLGSWYYGRARPGSGGKIMQKSHFAIVPLGALGGAVHYRLNGHRKDLPSIFERYGFSAELKFKPHDLRHLSNTLADISNIPVEIITAWSGRRSSEQTHTYIHVSHEDKADRVRAILNPQKADKSRIRVVAAEQLTLMKNVPASLTSTGICTQDLNVTPCSYLNDYVSQCFMCPETCYVAGDLKAIEFLEKDFSYQTARLEALEEDLRLPNSAAMQGWYITHSRHQHILSQLIALVRHEVHGSLIRYSGSRNLFSINDLVALKIDTVTCTIPDIDSRLRIVMERLVPAVCCDENSALYSILSNFGVADGTV
jgi:hypothetical protein